MKIMLVTLTAILLAVIPRENVFGAPFMGTEIGNGGEPVAQEFLNLARDVEELLWSSRKGLIQYDFKRSYSDVLDNTQISVKPRLFLEGVEVSAINYAKSSRIEISLTRWTAIKSADSKTALVLHEILGLMEIDDKNYTYSRNLLRLLEEQRQKNLANISQRLKKVGRFGHHMLPSKVVQEAISRCGDKAENEVKAYVKAIDMSYGVESPTGTGCEYRVTTGYFEKNTLMCTVRVVELPSGRIIDPAVRFYYNATSCNLVSRKTSALPGDGSHSKYLPVRSDGDPNPITSGLIDSSNLTWWDLGIVEWIKSKSRVLELHEFNQTIELTADYLKFYAAKENVPYTYHCDRLVPGGRGKCASWAPSYHERIDVFTDFASFEKQNALRGNLFNVEDILFYYPREHGGAEKRRALQYYQFTNGAGELSLPGGISSHMRHFLNLYEKFPSLYWKDSVALNQLRTFKNIMSEVPTANVRQWNGCNILSHDENIYERARWLKVPKGTKFEVLRIYEDPQSSNYLITLKPNSYNAYAISCDLGSPNRFHELGLFELPFGYKLTEGSVQQ